MIENVTSPLEVFTLKNACDTTHATKAILDGKIALFNLGSVFCFMLNPQIEALIERFNFLKERGKEQLLSLATTYEQAKQFVDKSRINQDFFGLPKGFCNKVISRIPIATNTTLPFSYDKNANTLQFFDIGSGDIREAFMSELAACGCKYVSITSGNLHGAPTVESLEDAKKLATLLNLKASFFGMDKLSVVVIDIPHSKGDHKGSYAILDFCNPNVISVKRLVNKIDKEETEKHLKQLFATFDHKTPLVFDV